MKIWYTYLFSPKTWPTELFQFYPEVGRREFQSVADEQELGILRLRADLRIFSKHRLKRDVFSHLFYFTTFPIRRRNWSSESVTVWL